MSLPATTPLRQPCPACGQLNSAPYLFCAACGAPRLRIGRWRVTANTTFALFTMLGTYYFADDIGWNWPLYIFYMIVLLQLMLMIAAGRLSVAFRVIVWFGIFMMGSITLWTLYHKDMIDLVVHALASAPQEAVDAALDYPLVFYPSLLIVLVLLFLPAYMRWGRLYGWVNAYRVILLTWLVLILAVMVVFRIAAWAHARQILPDLEPFMGNLVSQNEGTAHALAFAAVSLMRLFVLEICIFAALQSYARARRAQPDVRQAAAGDAVLARSGLAILAVARQIGQTAELMIRYLLETSRKLAIDVYEVAIAFLRELFLPTLAMIGIGYLLHTLSVSTRSYIDLNQLHPFLLAVAAAAGILFCALVFLACKSRIGFGRLGSFYFQLIAWQIPILMLFFLLLSVSLFATSRVVNSPEQTILPFRLGLLTIADAIILAVLVVIVFARKHTLLKSQPAPVLNDRPGNAAGGTHASAAPEESLEPTGTPVNNAESEITNSEKSRGFLARFGAMLTSPAPVRGSVVQLKSTVHNLKNMAAGKPSIIGQLARVRASLEEKELALRTLEQMKPTLSPETFETMRYTAMGEVNALRTEYQTMQAIVNQRYAHEMQQQQRLQTRVTELHRKVEEIKRLNEAGIGGKIAREQLAKFKLDLEVASARVEQNQRNIAWYMEEARDAPLSST